MFRRTPFQWSSRETFLTLHDFTLLRLRSQTEPAKIGDLSQRTSQRGHSPKVRCKWALAKPFANPECKCTWCCMESKNNDSFLRSQSAHFQQCLREAKFVGLTWVIVMIYTCTVIISQGYVPVDERPAHPALVLGIPSWVFWGLFVPWFAMIVVTWCFAIFYLKDDEPYMEFPSVDNELPANSQGEENA